MERRKITWKDVAMILLGIMISVSGFVIKDLYAKVDNKVDKTEFYAAIERIDKSWNEKGDLIIKLIQQHSEETSH